MSDTQKLFSKIIRDADKLDIMNEAITEFYTTGEEQTEIENGIINPVMYQAIQEKRLAGKQAENTLIDSVMVILAFVFDYNYDISYKIVEENNYINDIIDRFDYKNQTTRLEIEDIRNIINDYIISKIEN